MDSANLEYMTTSVIISRFNENLDWIKKINSEFEIVVYNKGDKIEIDKKYKLIEIKNVGRESHTWLYHISENYENISENNIFLQGRIDDLGCMAYKDVSRYLKNLNKNGFNASRLGLLSPFHWKDNLSIDKDLRYKDAWHQNHISKNYLGFRKYAKKFFPKIPIFLPTSYGGCFAVTRDAIHKHSKDFYSEMLFTLNKHYHPIEAHFLERLWCYMFSQNRYLPKAFFDVIRTKIERNILKKFSELIYRK